MNKIAFFLVISAGLAGAQASKSAHTTTESTRPSALDKKQFEYYVRHLFVWGSPIQVEVSDPKPSPLAGFSEVDVRATQGKATQEEKFYVSKDGKQIIRGTVYRASDNPFRENLKILKTAGHPSFGTKGAPVVIAEFSDFQCHFCKEEAKVFRENLLKEFPTQVHFYFMNYPLEGLHPWAKAGAMAAQCVYREGDDAFWSFHDWIFDHQEEITPENLKQEVLDWAKLRDLNTEKLGACIDSRATEAEVNATITMGHALEVNSTPTTFINGRPMVGATPWTDLKSVIDYEIGYQEKSKNAGENCGCDLSIPKLGVK